MAGLQQSKQNPIKQDSGAPAPQVVEEPKVTKAPLKRMIKRSGSGYTPSIKDAISGKFADEPEKEAAIDKIKFYAGDELHESFTQEQFGLKWAEYLRRLDERPSLKATLSKTPELFDGHKLLLKIDNTIQDAEISKIKPDLVSWLRKELRNTSIELITEVVASESEVKPYSETEKLIEMVKKNPTINLLKQTFNLDFGEH